MWSPLRWTQVLPLFLLATLAAANVYPKRTGFLVLPREYDELGNLRLRGVDDDGPQLNSNCVYICEVASCGNSCAPTRKRDFIPLGHPERPYRRFNETTLEWHDISSEEYHSTISRRGLLEKRVFNTETRWNKRRIASYLPGQVRIQGGVVVPVDTQFPNNLGFFAGGISQATVAQQEQFGNQPIQMGTGSLHGCTMMALISKRAVYMAHYWEGAAFNKNDDITGESLTIFQRYVLNTISGQGPREPDTIGEPVNWSLFDHEGDNTRLIFMTPLADRSESDMMYPKKINLIIDLVRQRIPGVLVEAHKYRRLNYRYNRETHQYEGPDANLIDTTERGIALFQYDGAMNYRLFYEHGLYRNTD